MTQTLLILDGDGAGWGLGGPRGPQLHDCFLRDAVELADRLPHTRPLITTAGTVRSDLAAALSDGPAVVITADVPHLPIWRLRDAFTYLCADAALVVGPAEGSGWYMLGLAAGSQRLLPDILAADPAAPLAPGLYARERVVILPAWYRLSSSAELSRLVADLAPMPAGVARHTRALLDDGLQAREVGS